MNVFVSVCVFLGPGWGVSWFCVIGCMSVVCSCVAVTVVELKHHESPLLIFPVCNGAVIGHLIRGQQGRIQVFPFLYSL